MTRKYFYNLIKKHDLLINLVKYSWIFLFFTATLSDYVPNNLLVPLNLPYVVSTFCKYPFWKMVVLYVI